MALGKLPLKPSPCHRGVRAAEAESMAAACTCTTARNMCVASHLHLRDREGQRNKRATAALPDKCSKVPIYNLCAGIVGV